MGKDPERFLGGPGQPVDVFAFRGGGFDTAMYLGVIQARLLLGRPPSLVTGVSAGAVAAAAMAEVYQAGEGREPSAARQEQTRRLREFLLAYASAPRDLIGGWLPDTYEVNANSSLVPLLLPTQFETERTERISAVQSKFGLVKLFNTILAIDLKVSVLTRIVRHLLELSRLREDPVPVRRWVGRLWTVGALWAIGAMHPLSGSVLLWTFLTALLSSRHVTKGRSAAQVLSLTRQALQRAGVVMKGIWSLVVFALLWGEPVWLALLGALSLISRDAWPATVIAWRSVAWLSAVGGLAVSLATGIVLWVGKTGRIGERVLRRFDLDAELGSSYDLQQFLVNLFDPLFYGRLNVDDAVDSALQYSPQPQTSCPSPKRLGDYTSVCVAPAVADLGTGELRLLGRNVSVVESLMAAMAVGPFLKARTLKTGDPPDCGHSMVDGVNVANEPISAVMDYLRQHVDPDAPHATIYRVSPFPSTGVKKDNSDFGSLTDVVSRVLAIGRVQTAELEFELTKIYSRLLPDRGVTFVPDAKGQAVPYVKARLETIDAEVGLDVNRELLAARSQEERVHIIYRAAAAGCRAALRQGLAPQLSALAHRRTSPVTVRCRAALDRFAAEHPVVVLTEGAADGAPGLPEVCAQCVASVDDGMGRVDKAPMSLVIPKTSERASVPQGTGRPERPWVTMALGGGVFRGVFQLGVLTALSELNVRPRLLAGSSVGSIMAAMAARLSSTSDPEARREMLRSAAATFLSLDLLIPTDRFSDFVRRFTLRAGAAEFSIRDADLLFRRYDAQDRAFSHTARRVFAGLERLFYVSPFEVRRITEAFRAQNMEKAARLVGQSLQRFLERSGIGIELLGAEPLRMLIEHLVFQGLDVRTTTLDAFDETALIVTATNLNQGVLNVLGMDAAEPRPARHQSVNLMKALLASSAFPAVFRPRSYAEVAPYAPSDEMLVDGGVTDNLPFHAVAAFLAKASDAGLTSRRPKVGDRDVPHLVLTASLEPKWVRLGQEEMARQARSWMKVQRRTGQIRYNRKADAFAKSQHDIRDIWNSQLGPSHWTPLDLEVVTIKPAWLPKTFGFHPMLGFRRASQAASIAHGCASTFAKLAHVEEIGDGWRATDWGFDVTDIRRETVAWRSDDDAEPWMREPTLAPCTADDGTANRQPPGACWFGHGRSCPFYSGQDESPRAKALHSIYEACGDPRTHRS